MSSNPLMGRYDYSETRFAANGDKKTTPKLIWLPEDGE